MYKHPVHYKSLCADCDDANLSFNNRWTKAILMFRLQVKYDYTTGNIMSTPIQVDHEQGSLIGLALDP